jgi:hypothetical protein
MGLGRQGYYVLLLSFVPIISVSIRESRGMGLTHGSEVKIAPWALASASAAWVASSCAPRSFANSFVEIAYA